MGAFFLTILSKEMDTELFFMSGVKGHKMLITGFCCTKFCHALRAANVMTHFLSLHVSNLYKQLYQHVIMQNL